MIVLKFSSLLNMSVLKKNFSKNELNKNTRVRI